MADIEYQFNYCKDEKEWSRRVKERDTLEGNEAPSCRWPGCKRVGTDAAHAFSRWNPALALAVEDGLSLCREHHRILDSKARLKKRETLKLLLGPTLYKRLLMASSKIFLWMKDYDNEIKHPIHAADAAELPHLNLGQIGRRSSSGIIRG